MSFEIKLPLFEGPFDLLLFFIQKDELDIYDIPISKITNDFLAYIEELEHLNIEVASEFILVAASLMRIKAKMLIPRPELDEEGEEVDPRQELVERLLEYKKYKAVIGDFSLLEELRASREKRGNVDQEIKKLAEQNNVELELQNVDMYKLLKVFEKVLERFEIEKNRPIHNVVQYPYTVKEQKDKILSSLAKQDKVSFEDLIAENPSKIAVIFSFLSILELLQSELINIVVGEGYNNFWLSKTLSSE